MFSYTWRQRRLLLLRRQGRGCRHDWFAWVRLHWNIGGVVRRREAKKGQQDTGSGQTTTNMVVRRRAAQGHAGPGSRSSTRDSCNNGEEQLHPTIKKIGSIVAHHDQLIRGYVCSSHSNKRTTSTSLPQIFVVIDQVSRIIFTTHEWSEEQSRVRQSLPDPTPFFL